MYEIPTRSACLLQSSHIEGMGSAVLWITVMPVGHLRTAVGILAAVVA